MFFRKESIDVGWSVYPDKGVIVFSYYDAEGKSTLYIGPAENAIEYDKIINDMFYY